MEGKVRHNETGRKGEIEESQSLKNAQKRRNWYSRIYAVRWDDGSLGWISRDLLKNY